MKENTGFIVALAYPEVVVRIANGEFISKLWPLFGVGGKHKVMAGHAAMLLVSKETNKVHYFDFGRYITSDKFGRVRSEETDNEVHIPIAAEHNSEKILNIDEILLFLDKHPEKTHGEGRMVVGVNSEINYDKALSFVTDLQNQGEVAYGAFLKEASNCARFVADAIIASGTNNKVLRKLKRTNNLTPSPLSNVINGSTNGLDKWEVIDQKINRYENTSLLKEYKTSLFSKVSQEIDDIGTIVPDLEKYNSPNGQWLGGIGSGAWFELHEKSKKRNLYNVVRRNYIGEIDLEGEFNILNEGFSIDQKFEFQYGSNCRQCVVKQNETLFFFKRVLSKSA